VHFALFLVGKLIRRQTPFGSAAFPTHATATAMHFPANTGLIFLTDELTNDRYLVDTGATLSIVPCNQNSSPSPLGVLLKKLCNFKASFLHQLFCKPLWPALFWALTFKENSKSLFLQNSAKYSLHVQQRPRPPIFCLQRLRPPRSVCLARHRSRSGSNSAAHCDNFFPASCHIRISSPESRGEVVQL
jgi:hypothetical protein